MRKHNGWRRRPRGVAIVYVALTLIGIIAVVGLAADTAYVFLVGHQLQNAADAAALAGADVIPDTTQNPVTVAEYIASQNKAAGASVGLADRDVQTGHYTRSSSTFTPGGTPTNAVKVTARRTTGSPGGPINLFFAPMYGITQSNVSRSAIAMNGSVWAAVLVLNKTASPSLTLTGTGSLADKILATGGTVVVDSNASQAVQWSGHPYITADELDIVGNDTNVVSGGVFPSGTLTLQSPVVPDPLASLPPPAKPSNTVTSTDASGNWPPGYYANGLPAGTLSGGIYYVDQGTAGDAINLKGGDTINAMAGCLIYLHTGGITMKGTSNISFNPMTTGPYAGIAFYEDRSDTSPVTLRGTSDSNNSGTLYFPSAAVSIDGTPNTAASQIIADTLKVQGTGQLNVDYDGRNPVVHYYAFLVQ